MDDFFDDPSVKTALQLMDWGNRQYELFPTSNTSAQRFVRVTDDDLAKALMSHDLRTEGFSETETILRDVFDHFLDRLERINSFVDARLISLGDVRPYLDYWAERLIAARAGDRRVDRLVQLRRYIKFYGYSGVEALFTRLSGRSFPSDGEPTA